jgi:excisionase family DNA binding protein
MNSSVNEGSGTSNISANLGAATGASHSSKRMLTKRELASALNVSQRTIENWMAQRRIPSLRLSARMRRFNLNKVEAALDRYEVKEVGARK